MNEIISQDNKMCISNIPINPINQIKENQNTSSVIDITPALPYNPVLGIHDIESFVKKHFMKSYEMLFFYIDSTGKKKPFGFNKGLLTYKGIERLVDELFGTIIPVEIKWSDITYVYKIDIKNSDFAVLDIDEKGITLEKIYELFPELEFTPYTRGSRGQGFHFWLYNRDGLFNYLQRKIECIKEIKGDFITDTIWENMDNNFLHEINEDWSWNEFGEEEVLEICPDFKFEYTNKNKNENKNVNLTAEFKGNYDELVEIVDNIPTKHSDNYKVWIVIISILKKYNLEDLARSFSKKSKKYNDNEFRDFYDNKTFVPTEVTIASIFEYSKENKTNFEKIKKKYQKQISKEKNNLSYELVEEEFNKTHFKVIDKKCFIRIKDNDFINYKPSEFKDIYAHKFYDGFDDEGKPTKIPFIKKYLEANPNMRIYDDIDIYPNQNDCPETHYNLWKPFAVTKIEKYEEDKEGLKIFQDHIKILCNHQEEAYEYILDFLSHLFKIPEEKPGIFILFVSGQGAGKGEFFRLIKEMIGIKKYLETSQPDRDVWGDFNGAMSDAFFVSIEELDFMQTKCNLGKFKSAITQNDMAINKKGKDLFMVTSIHRYMGSTNVETLPITTSKDDRRNVIIKCSDEKRGDVEYFNKLRSKINSKNSQRTFYDFLMKREGADLFRSKPLPKTTYQEDLKESLEDPLITFLREYVSLNVVDIKAYPNIMSMHLYKEYKKHLTENGLKYEVSHKAFGMKIRNLEYNGIQKIRKNTGFSYNILLDKICIDLGLNLSELLDNE